MFSHSTATKCGTGPRSWRLEQTPAFVCSSSILATRRQSHRARWSCAPENYLELPCQAIACSLANVPRRDSWPDEYKNLLDEQLSDRVVKVKVVHPASKGMRPTVNIEDKETGTDVAQTVLNYLHNECEQGNVSNYIIPEEPEEEEEEEDSQNSDQVTPKVDPVTTDQPNPQSVEMKSQQSQSTGDSSSSVLQRSLEIGSEY